MLGKLLSHTTHTAGNYQAAFKGTCSSLTTMNKVFKGFCEI
jgi:hypothetical protein